MSRNSNSEVDDSHDRQVRRFFDPCAVGKGLKEVGVDFLKVEQAEVKTRWFHGQDESDLFLWIGQNDEILKQQVSLQGQIVEWSIVEGLRTGLIIEEESGERDVKASEIIRFDDRVQQASVRAAAALIPWVEGLDPKYKDQMTQNFLSPVTLNLTARRVEPRPRARQQGAASVVPKTLWQRLFGFFKR